MHIIDEVGETHRSPFETVLPPKKFHEASSFQFQLPHLDLTPSHTGFKISQAKLHPDSLANMSLCLQLPWHKPCTSLMTLARPFQVKLGSHDARAKFLDLRSSLKADTTQQGLYYWDTTSFNQVTLKKVPPDIEKYVSPSCMLDSHPPTLV